MNKNKKIIKIYIASIIIVILNLGLFLNTYSIDNSAKLNLLKTEYNPGEEVSVSFENVPQDKVYYVYLKNDSNNIYTIGENNLSRRCILYQTNGSIKFLAPNKKGNWHFEIVSPSDLTVLAISKMFTITKEAHDNVIDDRLNILDRPFVTNMGVFNFFREGTKISGLYEFNNGTFEGEVKYNDSQHYTYAIKGKFQEFYGDGKTVSGDMEINISGDSEDWIIKWHRSDTKDWSESKGSWNSYEQDISKFVFAPKIDEISNGYRIEWNNIYSNNILGYNIYRKLSQSNNDFSKINKDIVKDCDYTDKEVAPRIYSYLVKAVFKDFHEETISIYNDYIPESFAIIEINPLEKNLTRIRNKTTSCEFSFFEKKPDYDKTYQYSRIVNNKLMLPIGVIMKNIFDSKISWNAKDKKASIIYNGKVCNVYAGKKDFIVDGKTYKFINPPFIYSNYLNVEIKTLLDALGMKTEWIKESRYLAVKY